MKVNSKFVDECCRWQDGEDLVREIEAMVGARDHNEFAGTAAEESLLLRPQTGLTMTSEECS